MLLKICLIQNSNLAGSFLHMGTSWLVICFLMDVLCLFCILDTFELGIVKLVTKTELGGAKLVWYCK